MYGDREVLREGGTDGWMEVVMTEKREGDELMGR